MDKEEAIRRFNGMIDHIENLKTIKRNSPEFEKWKRNIEILIEKVFGEGTRHIKDFNKIHYSLMAWTVGTPDSMFQEAYIKGLERARSVLGSFVEEITEYWPDESVKKETPKIIEKNILSLSTDINHIWQEIKKDLDVDKRAFGKKINFISDNFRKNLIFRDVAYSYCLANNGFSKSAVILAGGVIEELLRLYLIHNEIRVGSKRFNDYIKICEDKGLLKSAINRLSDSVRHFRNLVHLEREEDKKHTISKATAKGAVASIFTIANDF